MKFNIDKLKYDSKWFEFDGMEFLIKPWPLSKGDIVIENGRVVVTGEDRLERFIFCLVDWKNITDSNGKIIPCNKENKKTFFDFDVAGIPAFIIDTINNFRNIIEEESEKN